MVINHRNTNNRTSQYKYLAAAVWVWVSCEFLSDYCKSLCTAAWRIWRERERLRVCALVRWLGLFICKFRQKKVLVNIKLGMGISSKNAVWYLLGTIPPFLKEFHHTNRERERDRHLVLLQSSSGNSKFEKPFWQIWCEACGCIAVQVKDLGLGSHSAGCFEMTAIV